MGRKRALPGGSVTAGRAFPMLMQPKRQLPYDRLTDGWFASLGLGVTLWQGVYEGLGRTWLRWCDQTGNVLPTGAERAAAAEQHTTQAHQRAERLAAQLQALGVEPQEA